MKRENCPASVEAKQVIRREMRAILRAMTSESRAQASLEICRKAAALPAFRAAKIVAVFAPLPTEPDVHPLIEEAWAQGKRVVFPLRLRVVEAPRLEWHEVTAWEQLIVAGPLGLREPDPVRCPSVASNKVDCLLVPGLAFDRARFRLGRGGAFYDSALAERASSAKSIGLMFARQEIPKVPHEPHDQKLDEILTESE